MAYKITDECIKCGSCESECPVNAISEGDDKYVIDANECLECGAEYPMEAVLRAEGIPRCGCGGVIKPKVVLYGEPLPQFVCIGAKREIRGADTLIVAGTSLSVEPAASFLEGFGGKNLVVINREPTPADEKANLVLRGDVAEILGALD